MNNIQLVSKQKDMQDIYIDGVYYATAIKDEDGVTLDHVVPNDTTIWNITKKDGKPVKTWTATLEWLQDAQQAGQLTTQVPEKNNNMDNLKTVINTPLEDMDNKAIVLDNGDFYGFDNWQGVQHKGRYYGRLVYRTKSGMVASGQGTSAKGYTSKENALKYALADFENSYNERILPNI